MDVLIFEPFVWPKQQDDFDVVTARKLTGIGFESGGEHSITCRSSHAPARFIQDLHRRCFGHFLKPYLS